MPAGNKQKLKLLYLLRMLQQETDKDKGLTMAEILTRLESLGIAAERKSIYRDIAVLRDFGYDIKTYQRSPVEYALDTNDLSLSEVMMLVDVVNSSKFLSNTASEKLVKNLKKLVSERESIQLDSRVHVEGRIKSQNESIFRSVDLLHKALRDKKKVCFNYYKLNNKMEPRITREGKAHEVTPIKVIFSNGFYYLAAWMDKYETVAHFRIDRMKQLFIMKEDAVCNDAIRDYEYSDFESHTFGMFTGKPEQIVLRVKNGAMDAVVDQFGPSTLLTLSAEDYADVVVHVHVSPQFFGWIAGCDNALKIVKPDYVREEYKQWLQNLLDNSDIEIEQTESDVQA